MGEEMLTESRIAEEKAKKAMIDAARLADELRAEQENALMCEKNRKILDNQVKDMQTKLDEAEQLAVKGGKKVVSRLEQKIKDLEGQLDDEQRRLVDAQKSQRRTERRVKELTFSQDEDQRTTNACRSWWTSSRTRSSPTRSRSRRLRRSLPSTLQSSGRSKLILNRLRRGLTSTNRSWPSTRPRDVAPLLDHSSNFFLCKRSNICLHLQSLVFL